MQSVCKYNALFVKQKMNVKRLLLNLLIVLTSSLNVWAGPVMNTVVTYSQPDGSTFSAIIKGDEWTKIRTTASGHVITKDSDGWWCYGIYDTSGRIQSTGYPVGQQVPADILASSRTITYDLLSSKANRRRNIIKENALQLTKLTKSDIGTPEVKALVILVQFQDVKFKYKRDDFVSMLNEKGYNGTGSVKDYFEDQVGSIIQFSFDVSNIITLNRPVRYYGENDEDGQDIRPAEMANDACKMADKDVDFSLYDYDGDGTVDNVYIFYAGYDESEHTELTERLWAHQYYISAEGFDLNCDGKQIDRYACSSELSRDYITGIGAFCHEFSHTMGLMDLYDINYDKDGGWAAGLWRSTSLMDGGNYNNYSATPPYFNCIEREILDLSDPDTLEVGKSYVLEPINKNGQYFILETDVDNEYYLLECRSNEGWDKYIGGSGLLVYHIDKNMKEYDALSEKYRSKWKLNTINTIQEHQCADLIEADGRSDLISDTQVFQNVRGIFFPQDDVTSLSPASHRSYCYWSGVKPEISIVGISKEGENIRFSVVRDDDIPDVPDVINASYSVFPDAAIIKFESSQQRSDAEAILKWKESGTEEYEEVTLTAYDDGKFAYKIKGLQSGNKTYETVIQFKDGEIFGKPLSRSIMTKRKSAVTWPFIYMYDMNLADGILLHVVNAADAAEVEWKFDGKELRDVDDWFFKPDKSGVLQAEVKWKDGSSDVIIKQLEL